MTDRPIIFSSSMVRALLDGRKTQTRRLATSPLRKCEIGDRLYVREAHYVENAGYIDGSGQVILYRASDPDYPVQPWSPSIHMPRWASRLTLTVVDVRFEKLLDINAADCIAEGVQCETCEAMKQSACHKKGCFAANEKFRKLWDSLHGKPGETIRDNPDIVALTFAVKRGNIDR